MRRAFSFSTFVFALLAVWFFFAPREAEAQVLRFSTTASGKIIGTGNTLGLSKDTSANGPGVRDSIGTFVSLGAGADTVPLDFLNPWPSGTTNDWTQNGSTAVLDIPVEGEVLYAELIWGGSTNYVEDVTPNLGTPVTLTMGGATLSVSPSGATGLTIAQTSTQGFAANYYMRSADVTSFVVANGSGTYAVSGVPATQNEGINSLNAAGWTLVVAVHDSSEPIRNLSIFVGGSFVDEDSQQDYSVSGFCTPPAGPFNGHVVTSAIEGDANLVGDQLLIAPTAAGPFVNLDGPNNPSDNFFCSQINGADGLVDTNGSFGTANHNAALGVNVIGGRQGWDVTTLDISSAAGQLTNGQTSAVLRTITTGDSYVPTLAALAIDVNAPDFTSANSVMGSNVNHAGIGDSIALTLDLANTGLVTAQGVKLRLPIDPALSLTSFTMDGASGDIHGNPVDVAALGTGVDAGDLAAGQTRHVVIELLVASAPSVPSFSFEASWDYEFQVCTGGANLGETFGQFAVVAFDAPATTSSGTTGTSGGTTNGATSGSSTATGLASSTGTSGDGEGGSGGGGGNDLVDGSGCGCSVPGTDDSSWPLAGLALAGLVAVGRRRHR